MPSISQDRLKELYARAEQAEANFAVASKRSDVAEARVKRFDDILDKIGRAAKGLPLTDDRNAGYAQNYGFGSIRDDHRCEPPTTEEVLRQQVDALNERVVGLESRIAAVVAVATFAKAHKS